MEFLIFFIVVLILFLILNIKSSMGDKLLDIQRRLDQVTTKLNKLSAGEELSIKTSESLREELVSPKTETPATPPEIIKPIPERKVEPVRAPEPEPKAIPVQRENAPVFTSKHGPQEPPKVEKPGFFERNPDLEKFIGENLANKIGIGILVLGIGFFVKYAIDKEWINVYGRVFIGILCGGILITLAHRLRKSFAAFSSVLVGGGIAILYLTITIAFHEYQIISQTVAFVIMVLITAFTILLSLAYNRIELAILAILGGFGSPFMVSTGEGNYQILFTYILILDVGMLVLAYFKKWNPVTIIAYVFTVILFGSWLGTKYDPDTSGMMIGALIFATMFYLTFFTMNVINNLKERTKFGALEFSLLLSNTFLYYAAGMYILNNTDGDIFKGLFTASIGIFNFLFAFFLYKRAKADRNLVFLLIGLVLTFISLAAPIQLEGNYITLFWAAETVLLLWLGQQSGIKLMKIASAVLMVLMWGSLAMDWKNVYTGDDITHMTIVFNKGYVTTFVALISIFLFHRLLKNEKDYDDFIPEVRGVLTLVGVIVLYLWNNLELNHQLNFYVEDIAAPVILGAYNMLFILLLIIMEGRMGIPARIRNAFAGWGVFAALVYFIRYHSEIINARNAYLNGEGSFLGFGFHYLLIILLVAIAAWSVNRFRQLTDFNTSSFNIYSWFFVFFFVFLASTELDHTVVLTLSKTSPDVGHLIAQNHKIGYPILWGVSSFILIAIGLRRKRRHLRIISLVLFLITLLKLFLVDIKGISEGGKIAAFISLGILLLIVSFMYQRVKKFLMEDGETSAGQTKNSESI
jgi:uncharacterized membrane protein